MSERERPEGKRAELLVFSELLRRGLTVYLPIADVEGIDAIVRTALGKHIELHIRTPEAGKNPRSFRARNLRPRENYFILFLEGAAEPSSDVWILPSTVFERYATKVADNVYQLDLDGRAKGKKQTRSELLKDFKNAWDLFLDIF